MIDLKEFLLMNKVKFMPDFYNGSGPLFLMTAKLDGEVIKLGTLTTKTSVVRDGQLKKMLTEMELDDKLGMMFPWVRNNESISMKHDFYWMDCLDIINNQFMDFINQQEL